MAYNQGMSLRIPRTRLGKMLPALQAHQTGTSISALAQPLQ
jgi:hypothetical protein